MADRTARLRKLVEVQEQLKKLHETRRSGFLAQAMAAEQQAADLIGRFDAEDSLADRFPELYHRHIGNALERKGQNTLSARSEAERVAVAAARAERVGEAYREARRADERHRGDLERLERIERGGGKA